jgi:hypothetical protein
VLFLEIKLQYMSGRGDNNKHGTSGRGAGNQSNQPFTGKEKKEKSNHNRHQTGGERSAQQVKTQDQDANRNEGSKER